MSRTRFAIGGSRGRPSVWAQRSIASGPVDFSCRQWSCRYREARLGVRSDIGYELPRANFMQRAVQRLGQTRFGAALLVRSLRALHLLVHRISGGRTTFARIFGGFPIVLLTTTGARSGLNRTNPLTGIPHEDDVAVLGANYGLGVIPAWVYNLRSDPDATLTYDNHTIEVTAREVTGAEAEQVFRAASRIYPGYAAYRERFPVPIPAFVLQRREPVSS